MVKQIIKLRNLSLVLLLSSGLWAYEATEQGKNLEKKPVDEGQELKPKPDKIKDIIFVNTEDSNSTTTLSLEKENEIIVIKFETTSHVPITCKIIRKEKETFSITKEPKNPKVSRALTFKIDKSKLQVNDKIIITNHREVEIRKIEVKK